MKIHPREILVRDANIEFKEFIMIWLKKHSLTYGEAMSILGEELAGMIKYAVRAERSED